ncbi:MAG TPA: OmpA family protein [Puia sp.]|nr:OmpA family protein [Puia sp.]
MTKLLVCAATMLMATHILCAQDTSETVSKRILFDTTVAHQKRDTSAKPAADTTAKKDTTAPKKSDDIKLVVDKTDPSQVGSNQDFDNRWFISPLFKFQLVDYGMLEKNHFGYQSNANTLSMLDRSTISASLSAYKNITSRISASADIGLGYGHVTSTDVLVGTTRPKTYNVLDLTAYYHLLPGRYKLQPFISIGIHDLINDSSYLSAPVSVGLKFHSRKIMAVAQAGYGYGLTKNNASTVMYTVSLYVPVNFKKKKPMEDEVSSKPTTSDKPKDSLAKKNSDSTSKKDKDSLNNLNVNMDSVMKAKSSKDGQDGQDDLNDNGVNGKNGKNSKNGKGKKDGYDDEFTNDDSDNPNAAGNAKKGLKAFNYDDFSVDDFEVDTIDGKAVVKFVVYFEFNQYDLNSSAFTRIDKVIGRIKKDNNLMISIKGYTDNVGTNEFNMMLSRKRANIVHSYMSSRGISIDRMTSRFYGKENPVADNSNPNTAWLNRRAEIYIYEKGTTIPNVILPQAKYLKK